ncbi:hypothetical protein [Nocardioides halotolerans]|jgi:hypothetical protein|uniref:hypothetical protein n=1 Tax=Nocardioides halotolerans TaxID=433660 RepID=UPI000421138C|nr:hypothetical protein [Nocardioides halotolerans]
MRLARIVGAVVALLMTVTTGQALVSPADAQAKPRHHIRELRGAEVGHTNTFYIEGRVPTFPKGRIKVLRNVAGGHYQVWKKTRTTKKGKFRTPIVQAGRKKTCFKVQVPASATYRKTTSRVIGCIESG